MILLKKPLRAEGEERRDIPQGFSCSSENQFRIARTVDYHSPPMQLKSSLIFLIACCPRMEEDQASFYKKKTRRTTDEGFMKEDSIVPFLSWFGMLTHNKMATVLK
jgi:hypothetical protein